MRKLHAFFAAALMCAIAVVLCGAPVSAETTCRLAYTAKVQYAPQILALKKGWLSAPGVEFKAIDLGMSTGIAAAEAVVSGSADVAVMGDVPAIIALLPPVPACWSALTAAVRTCTPSSFPKSPASRPSKIWRANASAFTSARARMAASIASLKSMAYPPRSNW